MSQPCQNSMIPKVSISIMLWSINWKICTLRVSFLWLLCLGWLLVCRLYKEVYLQILNVCPFDCTAVVGSGKVGPVDQVHLISLVTIVTPTDRPKSVRNRCVIELFCGFVYGITFPIWHFWWCMGFCHRTESDLFLFLLISTLIPDCSVERCNKVPRRVWVLKVSLFISF